MQIEQRVNGDVAIVGITGDITLSKGGDVLLKDKIQSLLQQGHRKILLDMGNVSYVDSAGLGQLVQVYATTSHLGGSLKLLNLTKRLKDLLVPSSSARQEVRRKASVDVPAHVLKGASSLRIQIGFDGDEQADAVADTLTVNLVGNRKLERLTLLLELELKAKS